ncbi:MAG: hypothetical protein FJ191_00195 [Gammaproteobacteria bacterium]|nr:hypothetical protein [Gammaproteobacteria bacterium]
MAGNTFGTTTTIAVALALWIAPSGFAPAARAAGLESLSVPEQVMRVQEKPAERCESCSGRVFPGRAAESGPPAGSWDIDTFAVIGLFSGMSDHGALGVEAGYFRPVHVTGPPATGGIAGSPEGVPDRTLLLQQTGSGRLRPGDLLVLAARHQHNVAQLLESLGLWTRLPLGSAWRLGPRLRVDRRAIYSDGDHETLYLPSLRIDYERGSTWFGIECGAELARRSVPGEIQRSPKYFISFGYHVTF